ncbi:MAG: LacI family DNA-binding transcriptional regulator [Christensenellales bacterium]|jgi:LacI family repressor for deo operon, udp, cdd, tsx, nupC, and nupG
MSTIRDVANYANVSLSTVSKYFHHPDKLSEEYRNRVEAAVKKLNYTPNLAAQSMRTNKTRMIAFVVSMVSNQHYNDMYDVILSACYERGYNVVTFSTNESIDGENGVLNSIVNQNIDGIILAYVDEEYAIPIINNMRSKKPVVIMSCFPRDIDTDCVVINLYDGERKIVEHLIQLGHEKIAFCGGFRESVYMKEKENAYVETMREHRLSIPKGYMEFSSNTFASGYKTACRLLKLNPRPTAIVAANDILAIACIKAARINNLRVPEDIAVAGYDGIQISSLYEPGVTTLQQPVAQMGRMAVDLIMERIGKPKTKARLVLFNGELKIRQSTKENAPILLDI